MKDGSAARAGKGAGDAFGLQACERNANVVAVVLSIEGLSETECLVGGNECSNRGVGEC